MIRFWQAGTGRSRPQCAPANAGGPLRRAGDCLRLAGFLLLLAGALSTATAQSTCTTVPPIDPNGTFVSNFASNPCYQVKLGAGGQGTGFAGDLNAVYDIIYYKNNPRFELIFFGTFPQSRYMAISTYDSHEASIGSVSDSQTVPLSNTMVNPFLPGVAWKPDQKWAATVSFGGTQPTNITPGCSIDGFNIHNNWMDATHIHTGLSWNGDPLAASLPPHQDGPQTPNTAGAIIVRRYYDLGSKDRSFLIVRDLTTGCAVTANDALNTYRVVTTDRNTYVGRWRNTQQWQGHYTYFDQLLPRMCWAVDPHQQPSWLRGAEWLPGGNDNFYIAAQLPPNFIVPPVNFYIRVRLRLASFPAIPCATNTCTLTGNEQVRYESISVQNAGTTIASIADRDMVADPNGYVTLLFGIGAPRPSFATPANGYTWVDLTTVPNYTSLSALNMRILIPNASFQCQPYSIPNRYQQWTPLGGFMADYSPVIDFPQLSRLSNPARPLMLSEAGCGIMPSTPPVDCTTIYGPPPPAAEPF